MKKIFSHLSYTEKQAIFIENGKEMHKNKYSYDRFIWTGYLEKGLITCPVHGDFLQSPQNHMRPFGCKKCINENVPKMTTQDFIMRAKEKHGDKYDYSGTKYIDTDTKVKIICKSHGPFLQGPSQHIFKYGCPSCGKERANKDKMLSLFKEKHGEYYSYNKSTFTKVSIKIEIVCPVHGSFFMKMWEHASGKGCADCAWRKSKRELAWLDSLQVPEEQRQKILKIDGRNFRVDALDIENKIVYEFYGDYWHGNPARYKPEQINTKVNKTFKELYDDTLNREKIIKAAGFEMKTVWEYDLYPRK